MITLLEALKSKLNITWDDAITNQRLNMIIEDAVLTLNHKLGASADYSVPGLERNLFLNYCMYQFNNCAEDFEKNYKAEIYQVRRKYEVLSYKEGLSIESQV